MELGSVGHDDALAAAGRADGETSGRMIALVGFGVDSLRDPYWTLQTHKMQENDELRKAGDGRDDGGRGMGRRGRLGSTPSFGFLRGPNA